MALIDGDQAVLDDPLPYTIYNEIKNHWRDAAAPGNIQEGMIWSETVTDKLYHHGAADEEILQLTRSADVSPVFTTIKLSALTDGYVPYHVSDALGLADGAIYTDGTIAFIGDTANTKMGRGLTINQLASDNEILALKSSDIAHAMTDRTEADTYGFFQKVESDEGGMDLVGVTEGDTALKLTGWSTSDDIEKDVNARANVETQAQKISGNNVGNVGANANIFAVRCYVGDGFVTKFIVDEDGDILYDGTSNPYQGYDDIALLGELEVNLDKSKKLKSKNKYKKEDLKDAKLIRPFLSTKRLNMLLLGSIRQLNEKIGALEAQLNN